MSVTLKAGDLVFWEDGAKSAPILVDENETDLWFEYAAKPWHLQDLRLGKTRSELENILNGKSEWAGPGRLYKCYDAESDTSLADPQLLQ